MALRFARTSAVALLRRGMANGGATAAEHSVKNAAAATAATATTAGIPTTTTVPYSQASHEQMLLYAFDKQRIVQRLEEQQLSRKQAEAVMVVLNEVVTESLSHYAKRLVQRSEQEKHVYSYRADFAELKTELQELEKTDFNTLKAENERLLGELDKAKALMREEMNKLQFSVRLDQNLEKGRLRDEALVQEAKIKDTDKKIDTEISNIRTQLEALKFDIFKYIIGSLASALTLMFGYYRLIKS